MQVEGEADDGVQEDGKADVHLHDVGREVEGGADRARVDVAATVKAAGAVEHMQVEGEADSEVPARALVAVDKEVVGAVVDVQLEGEAKEGVQEEGEQEGVHHEVGQGAEVGPVPGDVEEAEDTDASGALEVVREVHGVDEAGDEEAILESE